MGNFKSGQAKVLSPEEIEHLFNVIEEHRHPEKNSAIMHISFCLGLRAQEIALLQIKEVAKLTDSIGGFELHKTLRLPKGITKGAGAVLRNKQSYHRQSFTITLTEFDRAIQQAFELGAAGKNSIDPTRFYPPVKKKSGGKARDLPMVHPGLRDSLERFLYVRLAMKRTDKEGNPIKLTKKDPLFITQKGGPYSPNTLQDHMAVMLQEWAGFRRASSHSGRRTLLTDVIHNQGKSVKIAQKIAGHKSPATTIIYEEPPEDAVADALRGLETDISN